MNEEKKGSTARRVEKTAGRRSGRNARYRMLVWFLLAWIAAFFVLNIIMTVRIVALSVEGKRLETHGTNSSQLV